MPRHAKNHLDTVVIQEVLSLRHRAIREQRKSFWIEGVRQFVEAFDCGWQFETVVYSPVLLQSPLADMLGRRLAQQGVPRKRVTPETFRALSGMQRVSGIGAIIRQRWSSLDDVDPTKGLCWLVIEAIQSPGNLGTIIRSAEAVGAAGVIFVGPQADPFDSVVVRASMGGLANLQIIRTSVEELACWGRRNGIEFVGLSPESSTLWIDLPAAPRFALVLGEERCGLSPALRELCQSFVQLPMSGHSDSLNVGVACGVMLYEFVRRSIQTERLQFLADVISPP